jgi:imidazolonepropionase-like amidohydrolase
MPWGSADLGTIEPGKLADLLVTAGSPSTQISDIRRLELVFKGGVAFEPSRIIMARRGVKTGQ